MKEAIGIRWVRSNMFGGNSGYAFDYFLGSQGIAVEAFNEHLAANILIAKIPIKGVSKNSTFITIKHGKVPQRLFDLALSVMLASPDIERYVGISWDGSGYRLYVPEQKSGGASCEYLTGDNVVVEMHSHPDFGPGFSPIDDSDEQGLKVYGCIGELDKAIPSVNFRVGVYGYFQPLLWSNIFEGVPENVIDVNALKKAGHERADF